MKDPASRLALMVKGLLPASQDAQGVYFVDRGGCSAATLNCTKQ